MPGCRASPALGQGTRLGSVGPFERRLVAAAAAAAVEVCEVP